jgi:hypothetical protein
MPTIKTAVRRRWDDLAWIYAVGRRGLPMRPRTRKRVMRLREACMAMGIPEDRLDPPVFNLVDEGHKQAEFSQITHALEEVDDMVTPDKFGDPSMSQIIDLKEAAKELGVSASSLRVWISQDRRAGKEDQMPFREHRFDRGKKWLVDRDAVREWYRTRKRTSLRNCPR